MIIETFIHRDYARRAIFIYIIGKDGDKEYVYHANKWKPIKKGEDIEIPTLSLKWEFQKAGVLQTILDELLKFGVKPTQPIENKGEMKRLENHLEDMRSLVFKKK